MKGPLRRARGWLGRPFPHFFLQTPLPAKWAEGPMGPSLSKAARSLGFRVLHTPPSTSWVIPGELRSPDLVSPSWAFQQPMSVPTGVNTSWASLIPFYRRGKRIPKGPREGKSQPHPSPPGP